MTMEASGGVNSRELRWRLPGNGGALPWLTLACTLIALLSSRGTIAHSARSDLQARIAALRVRLGEQLLARAQRREQRPGERADWDEGANLAMSARGCVELVRGGVTPQAAGALVDRAYESAMLAFEYEAAALRAVAASGLDADVRGWGTSKPLALGTFSVSRAIDAYSTGTALAGLSDVAQLLLERKDDRGRALYEKLVPIADYWLDARRFAAPGGPAFDKIAASDPEIRRHIVHNTDALMGRALLSLARAATLAGDDERARRYREFARSIARQLKHNVIDRIVDRSAIRLANWNYELVEDAGSFKPGRGEDTNHASYLLEFLDAAANASYVAEASWLTPHLLDRLGAAFARAIVRKPDGSAANALYIKATPLPLNARERQRAREFSFEANAEYPRAVVSLWRELSGEPRTLDLGLSLRTSWGWTKALHRRPDLLVILGAYLVALGDQDSRNLFLAQAVFWRESAALSESPRAPAAR